MSITTRSEQGRNHDENAPLSTRDIQDPAQKLSPASASPVAGAPDPLGSPVSTRPPG